MYPSELKNASLKVEKGTSSKLVYLTAYVFTCSSVAFPHVLR